MNPDKIVLSDDDLDGVAGGASVTATISFDQGELDGIDLSGLEKAVKESGGTWHAPGSPGYPHGGVSMKDSGTLEEMLSKYADD